MPPSYPPLFSQDSFSFSAQPCSHCLSHCLSLVICSSCHYSLPRRPQHTPKYSNVTYPYLPPGQHGPTMDNIAKAKAHISTVELLIADLSSTREALESFVRTEKYRTAPIRSLPNEILSLVFSNAAEKSDIVTGHMPALALSHVCGTWRDLAHSLPGLWSHIQISHLDVNTEAPTLCDVLIERLNHHYRLSKDQPIDILIPDHPEGAETMLTTASFAPVRLAMVTQSGRWQRLLVRSDLLEDAFVDISLPRLAYLELEDNCDGADSGIPNPFPVAPVLHSFVYRSICPIMVKSVYHHELQRLPLEQLTHLRGSFDSFFHHGARLSSLKDLIFDVLDSLHDLDDGESAPEIGSIILPSLERITILETVGPNPALGAFACPSMSDVVLKQARLHSAANICHLLSSSIAGITSFTMSKVTFADEAWVPIFSALPVLGVLRLTHMPLPHHLTMAKLTHFELLPLLEDFHYTSNSSALSGIFLSFLRSRTVVFHDAVGRRAFKTLELNMPDHEGMSNLAAEVRSCRVDCTLMGM